ncbi:MAG: hypothetical protein H7320_10540 [Ferruginibacter sp.]|nr:hypothetical protein [Ferruginibacter sp.]
MKAQYEQHCNAAGAAELGVPVIKSLKKKHIHRVDTWLSNDQKIEVDFKDETSKIIDQVLSMATAGKIAAPIKRKIIIPEPVAARWV